MKPSDLMKQAIDFNHATFSGAFDAVVMVQDQFEKVATSLLDQANWMPEEGRKTVDDCVDAYKSGRGQFKRYVDESFEKADEMFVK